jgi:tRNA(Ile)-lysidine synthase
MPSVQDSLFNEFLSDFDWESLVPRGSKVLCGFSGGADSTALLDMLLRVSSELGFMVHAAHLNHGLRGLDSDSDEQFTRDFCAERNIPLEISRLSGLDKKATDEGLSVEMAARNARYDFLLQTARKLDCLAIAVGHNADDLAENLLLRLLRGSGGRGLGSLKAVRKIDGKRLLRPLLRFHRAEILQYIEDRRLKFRIDRSNLETETERGKVRNVILPGLEKLALETGWSGVREALARSGALLAEDDDVLEGLAEAQLESVEMEEGRAVGFPFDNLAQLPPSILGRIILEAINRLEKDLRPEKEHIDAIIGLITGKRSGSSSIPGGFTATRTDKSVIVKRPSGEIASPAPIEFSLDNLPAEIGFGPYLLKFSIAETESTRTPRGDRQSHVGVEIGMHDELKILRLRGPVKGDRIAPAGMEGHTRKLSDIFIDRKIPREIRPVQPVLADAITGTVIALPAMGIVAQSAKATGMSKILDVSVEERSGQF